MHLVCILECIYVTVGMGERRSAMRKTTKRIHNTHMSFSDRTKAFGSWLRENNVELSLKVEISDWRSHGQGRAVVASKDIEPDEELFKLPRTVLLGVENCSLVRDKEDSLEKLLDLTQWEALIIVLLYEWLVKKDASTWKSYFDILPINDPENYRFNQLMFWSEEEIEWLKPSLITNRVGKEAAVQMYGKLFPTVAAQVLGLDELAEVTFEQFSLIATLIMSYSFDVELPKNDQTNPDGEHDDDEDEDEDDDENDDESTPIRGSRYFKCMVPLADTLNADTHKHNASLMYTSLSLVMRSIKPIAAGEQIYNTYSEHPNAEILRRYGYVEQKGSAHDFAEIPLSKVKTYFSENTSLSLETVEDILNVLREVSEEDGELYLVDSYDLFASGEVISELTFLVQLLTLMASINDQKTFNTASVDVKSRGVRRVLKKCYQLLEGGKLTKGFIVHYQNLLKARLKEYPKLASKEFPEEKPDLSRQEMATIVLISEYKSLLNCLDTDKVYGQGETVFTIIDDGKILRNIMKKDVFEGGDDQVRKKQKFT